MKIVVDPCWGMQEVIKTKEEIKSCYERLDNLEEKLKTNDLPEDTKSSIETELIEVRKLLAINERQLSRLHQTHISLVVIFIVFFLSICFIVFSLYTLITRGTLPF